MNLAQLQAFLSVAQNRSFSKAAIEQKLSQSGISRQIQRLEKENGVILFERNYGNVKLTQAGEHFRDYVEKLLAHHRQFLSKIKEISGTMAGKFRIIASSVPGEFLMPELLKRFVSYYPGLQTELFVTDPDRVIAELRDGRWDIGFVENLAKKGLSIPTYQIMTVLNSSRNILLSVESGYGIGWVSSLALGSEWEGRVAIIHLDEVALFRQLYMVLTSWQSLQPIVRAFIEFIFKEARIISRTL